MITVFDIETSFQIIDKKKDPSFNNPDNFIVSIGINDEYFFFKHKEYSGEPDVKKIQDIFYYLKWIIISKFDGFIL